MPLLKPTEKENLNFIKKKRKKKGGVVSRARGAVFKAWGLI